MIERIKPSMTWDEKVDITCRKLEGFKAYKPSFKDWMLNLPCKQHFFDHKMYFRCWQIYNSLRDDNDHFILMLAEPGTGKSTLLLQMGATISPDNFRLQLVSYDFEGFVEGLIKKEKYDFFDLDEGGLILNSADRSSKGTMLDKLSVIMRQFNLCVGICMTDFLLLRRHFRNTRINTMIHLTKRGKYRIITGKGIDAVRQQIRNKNGNMSAIRMPNGTFYDGYFSKAIPELNDINEESYLAGKHKNAEKFVKEIEEMASEVKQVKEGKYMSLKEAAKSLSICTKTVKSRIKDGTLKGKKIGSKWCVSKDSVEE